MKIVDFFMTNLLYSCHPWLVIAVVFRALGQGVLGQALSFVDLARLELLPCAIIRLSIIIKVPSGCVRRAHPPVLGGLGVIVVHFLSYDILFGRVVYPALTPLVHIHIPNLLLLGNLEPILPCTPIQEVILAFLDLLAPREIRLPALGDLVARL